MDMIIQIADIPVSLSFADCDPAIHARIIEHYQAFLTQPQDGTLSIQIRCESGAPFIPPDISTTWQIRTSAHHGRIEFESYYERGWVDRLENRGGLLLRPQGDPENFLRVVYAWLCLEQSALLIHAAGVIQNERGFVFFGHSGSGKTTLSRLSLNHTVLSDDLVIIKKQNKTFRLYGVPFRGDFPEAPRTNAAAELVGLFALSKSDRHYLAPLAQGDAVARLAACVPFVMTQPLAAQRVIEICSDLARHMPMQTLHFARDNGFWKVLDGFEKIPSAA